jgi:hypothetical protein
VHRLLAFACCSSETAGPYASPVGMTKLRAVAHLGMRGGGWTESKKLIPRNALVTVFRMSIGATAIAAAG